MRMDKMSVAVLPRSADHIPNFYSKRPLPEGFIDEVLSEKMDLWTPANPVLINTPPGSGKTHFIYQVVIPKAIEAGKNVLLVSNRTGLSDQEKYTVMNTLQDPRKNYLTSAGVRAQEDFGPVRVITYHRLPSLVHDPTLLSWITNLGFVVFDEAHFFAADAVFNQNCDYLLRLATKYFCHTVRIYLTGTAEDIMEPLANAEEKNFHYRSSFQWQPFREFLWYYRTCNYDQYCLSFFKNLEELLPLIRNNPKQKWLIFVDSKHRGAEFSATLGKKVAVYLDAERKGSKDWNTIIENGQLPTQVLVTTSVLDNGLNILDKDVKNIVVIADNRTALVQMVGRRRLSKGEKINLFVCDLSRESIAKRLQQCDEWLSYYEQYDTNISPQLRKQMTEALWRIGNPQLLKLFRFHGGNLYANELARHNILRRCFLYRKIINGETTFQQQVISWLNLPPKDESPDVSPGDLEEFYQANGAHALSSEQKAELRTLIVALYEKSGKAKQREDRAANLSPKSLNKFLNELEFGFEIINTNDGWRFMKLPM